MENTQRAKRNRLRRRGLLALLVAGTALIGASGASMSLAQFTSTPPALVATFTTGTIVLTTSPITTFSATGMMPGDSVSQVVTVTNGGSGALRYSLTSTFSETKGLAGQLDVTIAPTTTSCSVGVGTAIYTGKLNAVHLGDPTVGSQPGDRSVNGGATELLCFTASLPLATGDTFQGATASATLTFSAEQTANNP